MSRIWTTVAVVICVALAGTAYVIQPDWHHHDEPLSTVRVGLLPRDNWQKQKQLYEPLLVYLSRTSGMDFKLVRSDNYEELLKQFNEHEIDMANFGGLTFVRALKFGHAQPLVMRNHSLTETSLFIVPADSTAQSMADLSGKRLCFGSKQSTSGHLMPRFFLLSESDRIVPENYFRNVCYTSAHDKTVYSVRDGKADVGVVKATVYEQMQADGRLQAGEVRIIWRTPPFADDVWAVHDDIAHETRTKIVNAFLQLDEKDPVDQKILSLLNANYYLPARETMFDSLVEIAGEYDLLNP